MLWRRYILEVLGFLDRDGKVVKGRIGSAVTGTSGAGLIASADFHGMKVEVVRCADVGRVSLKGIVVRETRSTVTIVCDEKEDTKKMKRQAKWRGKGEAPDDQDKVRMIMKKGTVFRVVVDLPIIENDSSSHVDNEDVDIKEADETKRKARRHLVFELHGDQLEIRPIERAVKKFKWRPMDYL